jgi:hypothetical protein
MTSRFFASRNKESLLRCRAQTAPASNLQLWYSPYCDPAATNFTFAGVEGSPYLWRPVATTLADAMTILRAAVAEMDARYRALARGGFVNLGERLPFLVLIFDEFADLILAARADK